MHTDKLVLTYSKLFRTVKTSLDDSSMSNIAADKSRLCIMPFFSCVVTRPATVSHTDGSINLSCAMAESGVLVRGQQNPASAQTDTPSHLKDAVAVLRQRCRRVGRVHLRELFGKVADVQLIPDHRFEGSGHLLSCQVLPVDFLK